MVSNTTEGSPNLAKSQARDRMRRHRATWDPDRRWEERRQAKIRMRQLRYARRWGTPPYNSVKSVKLTSRERHEHVSDVATQTNPPAVLKGSAIPLREQRSESSPPKRPLTPPSPQESGGQTVITWRGNSVPWRLKGGKLRWLPAFLTIEELEYRLDRKLGTFEGVRRDMAAAVWNERRRGPDKPKPGCWNDGRPIVGLSIHGEPVRERSEPPDSTRAEIAAMVAQIGQTA